MKNFIILTVLFSSFQAISAPKVVEFDEATEMKCHEEFKKLKCVTSQDEENVECVEAKKAKLSKDCQEMHQAKLKR